MFGIRINNFRSLSDQYFDFSRVNILIGENSSGKSSLIKFLLFLKRNSRLTSSSVKYTADLGKFEDFIFCHNDELSLSFDFLLGNDYIKFFTKQLSDKEGFREICKEVESLEEEHQQIKLSFSFDKNVAKSNYVQTTIENSYFGKIELKRKQSKEENIIEGERCDIKFFSRKHNREFFLEDVGFEQHGFFSLSSGIDVKSKLEKSKENNAIFYDIAFLMVSQNFTEEILKRISYINPISSTPERSYDENDRQGRLYKVKDIKDVVNILSDKTLDQIVQKHLLENLNNALRFYGILYEIKTIASDFGPKELKVKLNKNGIWSNIKDVGYGSSLQIPIIFQALIAEHAGGETIIIEQPEVHVHPLLQSRFIETLLKISPRNTYIIETHSVDLVRKLQVLVKNNQYQLSSNDVNIHYFRKENNKTVISNHEINPKGKLTPKFPPGFYDSSVNLVKELF